MGVCMASRLVRVTVRDNKGVTVYEAEGSAGTLKIAIKDIARRKGAGTAIFTMELVDSAVPEGSS